MGHLSFRLIIWLLGIGLIWGQQAVAQTPDWMDAFMLAVEEVPEPLNLEEVRQAIGYPAMAMEAEIEGRVLIQVFIDSLGVVQRSIVRKDPHPTLTNAVSKKISLLRFSPARHEGKSIPYQVTIAFSFNIESKRSAIYEVQYLVPALHDVQALDSAIAQGKTQLVRGIAVPNASLHSFPLQILKFEQLRVLDLSGNPIQSLPAEIGSLRNLEILILDRAALTELPAALWTIPGLRIVSVRKNLFHHDMRLKLEREHADKLFPKTFKGKVFW